jgi:hypothetical protein
MGIMTRVTDAENVDFTWKGLYRVGGVATLIAGVITNIIKRFK